MKDKTLLQILVLFYIIAYALGIVTGLCIADAQKEQDTANESAAIVETIEETAPTYKTMTVETTAYCACKKCCGKTDGITATGTQATAGRTIAVDPSVIPYGTEVIISGNTYIAEDCGGAIKGDRIDIYFNTHGEALEYGRQTVTAYIPTAA